MCGPVESGTGNSSCQKWKLKCVTNANESFAIDFYWYSSVAHHTHVYTYPHLHKLRFFRSAIYVFLVCVLSVCVFVCALFADYTPCCSYTLHFFVPKTRLDHQYAVVGKLQTSIQSHVQIFGRKKWAIHLWDVISVEREKMIWLQTRNTSYPPPHPPLYEYHSIESLQPLIHFGFR